MRTVIILIILLSALMLNIQARAAFPVKSFKSFHFADSSKNNNPSQMTPLSYKKFGRKFWFVYALDILLVIIGIILLNNVSPYSIIYILAVFLTVFALIGILFLPFMELMTEHFEHAEVITK